MKSSVSFWFNEGPNKVYKYLGAHLHTCIHKCTYNIHTSTYIAICHWSGINKLWQISRNQQKLILCLFWNLHAAKCGSRLLNFCLRQSKWGGNNKTQMIFEDIQLFHNEWVLSVIFPLCALAGGIFSSNEELSRKEGVYGLIKYIYIYVHVWFIHMYSYIPHTESLKSSAYKGFVN